MQKSAVLVAALFALVLLTYANHFANPFHFDDSHAVVDNQYIRDLRNAPLFFTAARTFSNLPANRSYRPLVSLSLAVDYWLAHGLKPVFFQTSTFLWFLVQLALMYVLFLKICDRAGPHDNQHENNKWIAIFAAALYGVHPAVAETVNYVIQRGDLYSTLGVIAGLAIYAFAPRLRRFGLYLLPVALALLSKPPALIFPALLFTYILLFEDVKPVEALRRCIPAVAIAGGFALLTSAMTPGNYTGGAVSGFAYRISQPLAALRYFRTFFIPDQLSADTDHVPVNTLFENYAWLGFLFVTAVGTAARWCSKRREWRPVSFGLWWFLLALAPTSLFPLAEVENDHRMFFPFVGLTLAVCWTAALGLRHARRATRFPGWTRIAVPTLCLLVLAAFALGARNRNEIWHSDESLWLDVTQKSPRNGRGLMNYGLTQLAKGDTHRALAYFEQARAYTPAYYVLEINLGIARGVLNQDTAAEQHFLRAIQLAPDDAISNYFYARWLQQKGRRTEAETRLRQAVEVNPDYLAARYLLMDTASQQGDWAQVKQTADGTLSRFPADAAARRFLSFSATFRTQPASAQSADDYLNLSLSYHQAGQFQLAIEAAKQALKLKPDYAEAYNNIAAGYEAIGQWNLAIDAARRAVKLRPDFKLARNNLAWSEDQQKKDHGTKFR